jgi:hypothetical protein
MKRICIYLGIFLAVVILALPASAGSRRYAQNTLDDWTQYVADEGYEVFYSDIDMIDDENSVSYYLDLEPGSYILIAEGGEDLEDIDMYVYDSDGYELDSDTLADNYPICQIDLRYPEEIEVEIIAYSFVGREYEDYYCFVAGAQYSENYGNQDAYMSDDLQNIMGYWTDWADESNYDVVYTNIGVLSRDESAYFDLDLEPGSYHIYAESLEKEDDIDLYVRDDRGRELQSDTLSDNYPICSFELNSPESVEVEVAPYTYAVGNSTEFAIVVAVEGAGGVTPENIPDRHTPGDEPITDRADYAYVNELRGDYMDMIIQQNYENIYDEIDLLDAGGKTVRITLGRGDYRIYAEGGLRIVDLDMSVYDEDGDVIAEDVLTDNYPVCEFTLYESTSVEIEVYPYEMESGWHEGYYVLVVTR